MRDFTSTSRHSPCAYTLVELVMVVLIMGILAGVAVPKYVDSLNGSRVDAAANRIVVDLKLSRARAVLKGSANHEEVKFYPSAEKYTLYQNADLDQSSRNYWVDFTTSPYPVDLVSSRFTNDKGAVSMMSVSFDMYGRPWCGSSPSAPMVLGEIVVQSGSEQRKVVINPVTGLASVQ